MLKRPIILSLLILLVSGCQLRPTPTPPVSPLPTPISPLPTPTATSPVSPLATPFVAQQVATATIAPSPTATSWHSGVIEVWCDDDAVSFSPLGLVSAQPFTMSLVIQLQIRQDEDLIFEQEWPNDHIVFEQEWPGYQTMQQFESTIAPDVPCEGLFMSVPYDWAIYEDTYVGGEVEEWVRLYWRPNPLTATLYISDTNGKVWEPDNQPWAFVEDGTVVTPGAGGYVFNRALVWGTPTPTPTPTRVYRVYLPVVLK